MILLFDIPLRFDFDDDLSLEIYEAKWFPEEKPSKDSPGEPEHFELIDFDVIENDNIISEPRRTELVDLWINDRKKYNQIKSALYSD